MRSAQDTYIGLKRIVGDNAIESADGRIWFVNWNLSKMPRAAAQAGVFRYFFAGNSAVLDAEESPEDCPIILSEDKSVRGVGRIYHISGAMDLEPLISWLSVQVWLAVTPKDHRLVKDRLVWSVEQFFAHPSNAVSFLREVGASRVILSYYDGDEWLLAEGP